MAPAHPMAPGSLPDSKCTVKSLNSEHTVLGPDPDCSPWLTSALAPDRTPDSCCTKGDLLRMLLCKTTWYREGAYPEPVLNPVARGSGTGPYPDAAPRPAQHTPSRTPGSGTRPELYPGSGSGQIWIGMIPCACARLSLLQATDTSPTVTPANF